MHEAIHGQLIQLPMGGYVHEACMSKSHLCYLACIQSGGY